MLNKALQIIVFNYGKGFLYRKAKDNHNPNSKSYKSDGSVKRFKISCNIYEYQDWQLTIRLCYNYTFIIRIYLNR